MFSKGDTIQMVKLDEYGYAGREYHPHGSDVGLLCEVLSVEEYHSPDFFDEEGDCDYVCYKVLTYEKEPRFLELMDHEVSTPVETMSPSVLRLVCG